MNHRPQFLARSTGGFFKENDPTVDIETLKGKWLESAIVVYVGRAGGTDEKTGKKIASTLRSRLKLYFDFGAGKPVG